MRPSKERMLFCWRDCYWCNRRVPHSTKNGGGIYGVAHVYVPLLSMLEDMPIAPCPRVHETTEDDRERNLAELIRFGLPEDQA